MTQNNLKMQLERLESRWTSATERVLRRELEADHDVLASDFFDFHKIVSWQDFVKESKRSPLDDSFVNDVTPENEKIHSEDIPDEFLADICDDLLEMEGIIEEASSSSTANAVGCYDLTACSNDDVSIVGGPATSKPKQRRKSQVIVDDDEDDFVPCSVSPKKKKRIRKAEEVIKSQRSSLPASKRTCKTDCPRSVKKRKSSTATSQSSGFVQDPKLAVKQLASDAVGSQPSSSSLDADRQRRRQSAAMPVRAGCSQCGRAYDGTARRRMTEQCGHARCLQCAVLSAQCKACCSEIDGAKNTLRLSREDTIQKTLLSREDIIDKTLLCREDIIVGRIDERTGQNIRSDIAESLPDDFFDDSCFEEVDLSFTPPASTPTANHPQRSCSGPRRVAFASDTESDSEIDLTLESSQSANNDSVQGAQRDAQWLNGNIQDCSSQFRNKYKHSTEVGEIFKETFGLHEFRRSQEEIVNATILGNDCFVIMPTGGGKSLCYQLPAVYSSKHDGSITFVISPLKALIHDQVQKLNALDVSAYQLKAATVSSVRASREYMIDSLAEAESIQAAVVYLTPEKLASSSFCYSQLSTLYRSKKIARFVIDEAHCISEWGHDFRPDYKQLGKLRFMFPNVPLMLLTATATHEVQRDVMCQMRMDSCKLFIQSFNRPNLEYVVMKKEGAASCLRTVVDIIRKEFDDCSGIVYCFSRNDTEKSADHLTNEGIPALPYHAGMSDSARIKNQQAWMDDGCMVICATIAFGMGIDKSDVRFIFHLSIPKSIEGYYQESGRAGRDWEESRCVVFYSYHDVVKIKALIHKSTPSPQALARNIEHVHRVVQYCENSMDCRRSQLLTYFGEKYASCASQDRSCDICSQSGVRETSIIDVTALAGQMIHCVAQLSGELISASQLSRKSQQLTLSQYVDIFKGSNSARIVQAGFNRLSAHACASKYTRSTVERLLMNMVMSGYLKQKFEASVHDTTVAYLFPGPKSRDLLSGAAPVCSTIQLKSPVRLMVEKGADKCTANTSIYSSTVTPPADMAARQENEKQLQRLRLRCFRELQQTVRALAETDERYSRAYGLNCIKEMAQKLPCTKDEMLQVTEITKAKYDKFQGDKIMTVTRKFREEAKERNLFVVKRNSQSVRTGSSSGTGYRFKRRKKGYRRRKGSKKSTAAASNKFGRWKFPSNNSLMASRR